MELTPQVISCKWTRNNHLVADELTLTFSWKESGIDPRQLHNARVAMYMCDEALERMDRVKHLRFSGICMKVSRKRSDSGVLIDMTFADYTTMFINMKPARTEGMPEWSDTLDAAWKKLCDNVGHQVGDGASAKIESSVTALRNNLTFEDSLNIQGFQSRTIGSIVNTRFHAISKPTPPNRCDAWAVWQWVVTSLGLMSYIDRDRCFITKASAYYSPDKALQLIWGHNVSEFEESADAEFSQKGVLAQSFDPLTGRVLEAFYPEPGDPRLKTKKSAVKRAAKGKGAVNANDVSSEWEPYEAHHIHTQEALEAYAEAIYEERSRQAMEGTIKTSEMRLDSLDGDSVDILDLVSGDAITVGVAPDSLDMLENQFENEDDRINYLVYNFGYKREMAELVAKNVEQFKYRTPIFHVSSMTVSLEPDKFDVEIKYHNIIALDK